MGRIDAHLERELPRLLAQAPTVPAVSIALVADAKLLWRGAFGVKDLEAKTPVDHDTVFEAGSVSKTVFAYAVLKACEKGVLDLDTPLTNYTPDRFLRDDPRLELITARHEANLFVPFGMTSSGYLYQKGMARPYDDKGAMLADRKSTPVQAARYASAGNLHTTASDYAKFLIEVLDPKPSDAYRLNAASLGEMVKSQVKVTDAFSWGLGWSIDTPSKGDIISHSGDNPGYKSLTAASLSRKSAFIILSNGDRGFEIITQVVKSELMRQFLPLTVGA
jgi:CubicO group peptidase (beta-lactamase class C family)